MITSHLQTEVEPAPEMCKHMTNSHQALNNAQRMSKH